MNEVRPVMILSTLLLTLFPTTAAHTPLLPHEDGAPTVEWVAGPLTNATGLAREREQRVLVYCWRDGSEYCAKLYQETLSDAQAADAMANFVCYSANHGDAQGAELIARFNVQTLPTLLFLSAEGKPEDSIAGFIPAAEFVHELERIGRGEGILSDLEARRAALAAAAKNTEQDFELRMQLAGKHQELGDQEKHDAILATIRQDDPKAKTDSGARAFLWDAQNRVIRVGAYADPDGDGSAAAPDTWDLEPLYAHAKRVKAATARYEAWNSVGNYEARRGEFAAAAEAFDQASRHVDAETSPNWCEAIAVYLMNQEGEWATSKHKKLVLALAERSHHETLALEPGTDAYAATIGDHDRDMAVAEKTRTLSRALYFNGKQKQALARAEEALAVLTDDEDLKAQVASWRGEG